MQQKYNVNLETHYLQLKPINNNTHNSENNNHKNNKTQ